MYRSVYLFLCSEVHGSVGALFRRHLNFREPRPEVVLYREPDANQFLPSADTAVGLLMAATEIVHALWRGGNRERIAEFRRQLEQIRDSHEHE